MLAGAIAFEISDIQEDESEAALARRSNVTMLHWVENGWMEFSRSTIASGYLALHSCVGARCGLRCGDGSTAQRIAGDDAGRVKNHCISVFCRS